MSDLRERVARAICHYERNHDADWPDYLGHASAAIAIVLEQAAKVADENACDCCFYIAAAIRALK